MEGIICYQDYDGPRDVVNSYQARFSGDLNNETFILFSSINDGMEQKS